MAIFWFFTYWKSSKTWTKNFRKCLHENLGAPCFHVSRKSLMDLQFAYRKEKIYKWSSFGRIVFSFGWILYKAFFDILSVVIKFSERFRYRNFQWSKKLLVSTMGRSSRIRGSFVRTIPVVPLFNKPGTAQVGAISKLKNSKRTSKCQVITSAVLAWGKNWKKNLFFQFLLVPGKSHSAGKCKMGPQKSLINFYLKCQ